MKPFVFFLSLALLVGSATLIAESPSENSRPNGGEATSGEEFGLTLSSANRSSEVSRPFSLGATAEGVSSLGAQFQFATNLNSHMNLRSHFNLLLWQKWITYGGFTTHAHPNMGSTNTSLDIYPFRNHGLRFSPGVLIHNPLVATAQIPLAIDAGPFTLNGHTYYGSQNARALEGVQMRRTAFTMTTGWGNMIPRKTGNWSFPVELGVAFLGSPSVVLKTVGGKICDAQGNCVISPVGSELLPVDLQKKLPALLSDLQAHFGPYKSHLDLLRTYPIISFGVAYSGHLRSTPAHY